MNKESKAKIWIAGCGDIGQRVSKQYSEQKQRVRGIVRSKESQQRCAQAGIETIISDFAEAITFEANLLNNACVFYFAPPPPVGKEDTSLARFLDHIGTAPQRIVMISTTGVYGDSRGDWIDETAAIKPKADRAFRRLDAETRLSEWAKHHNREFVILRVPGIYALDRLPLARIRKGLPVLEQKDARYTNRIHADDLARVCRAAMDQAESGEIFNVTDGHPSTMTDYFNQVADYASLPRPPQISYQQACQELSKGMLSYLEESRKISNRKLLDVLQVELQYPSLSAALSGGSGQSHPG